MDEVVLNIYGSQTVGENKELIEFTTQGLMERKGQVVTLIYEDSGDDSEAVRTAISVDGDVVTMEKQGSLETQFIFETSKTFSTVYSTPFGDLDVTLFPTLVEASMGETSGRIDLEYVLSIGDTQMVNRLNLLYEAKKH